MTEPDLRGPPPSDSGPDWDKVDASYEAPSRVRKSFQEVKTILILEFTVTFDGARVH